MVRTEQAACGLTTHPGLRRSPEAPVEEEGGLPPASVAGEGTVVQKVSPTLPTSALGWQETQGMETRQGCVEEEGSTGTSCAVTRALWRRKWSES